MTKNLGVSVSEINQWRTLNIFSYCASSLHDDRGQDIGYMLPSALCQKNMVLEAECAVAVLARQTLCLRETAGNKNPHLSRTAGQTIKGFTSLPVKQPSFKSWVGTTYNFGLASFHFSHQDWVWWVDSSNSHQLNPSTSNVSSLVSWVAGQGWDWNFFSTTITTF